MKNLLLFEHKNRKPIHLIFTTLFLLLGVLSQNTYVTHAGLPFRLNYVTIDCSPGTGAFSRATIDWFDYPSTTTGSAVSQSFKWTNGTWVIKSSYSASGGPSSSGTASALSLASPGPGSFQGRGFTWLNGSWRVDMTSGTKYCN